LKDPLYVEGYFDEAMVFTEEMESDIMGINYHGDPHYRSFPVHLLSACRLH
jgi:hypothetical protein